MSMLTQYYLNISKLRYYLYFNAASSKNLPDGGSEHRLEVEVMQNIESDHCLEVLQKLCNPKGYKDSVNIEMVLGQAEVITSSKAVIVTKFVRPIPNKGKMSSIQ
ncbi:hypothetical protein M8C21_001585, partial [Ambrosia artemisiifolia]